MLRALAPSVSVRLLVNTCNINAKRWTRMLLEDYACDLPRHYMQYGLSDERVEAPEVLRTEFMMGFLVFQGSMRPFLVARLYNYATASAAS